jgi:hypothetical protein
MNGHCVLMGEPIETPGRTRYPVAIAVHADHAHNILPDTFCQSGCAIGVAVKFLDGILFLISASLDPYTTIDSYMKSLDDVNIIKNSAPKHSRVIVGVDSQTSLGRDAWEPGRKLIGPYV